ncbi:PPOX class F420-dependent oxidoreductase [uncultured Mycolicibacterium sp.]|uniref:PPOX class F420-dependent oxidoreductase n=1 Tax=uncultured Mycolicibacterium sp. TaxID=2320817 RepID=UPI00262442B3|nr:PPOX class F420-dependent oxidoreductase [uncultured Mycolicibacterium sp.]
MATTFADVAKSNYLLLTTFTRDGRPKPTPVWAAPDGDRLLVITQADSWKVKRIRNTPRVTIAPCDVRGNAKGEAVEAVATVLDPSVNPTTLRLLGRRYGLFGKAFIAWMRLRGATRNSVTVELKPAA